MILNKCNMFMAIHTAVFHTMLDMYILNTRKQYQVNIFPRFLETADQKREKILS